MMENWEKAVGNKKVSRKVSQLNLHYSKVITWFANNQMKADHDNCRLLLSTQDEANI